jgi:hypothetical protein
MSRLHSLSLLCLAVLPLVACGDLRRDDRHAAAAHASVPSLHGMEHSHADRFMVNVVWSTLAGEARLTFSSPSLDRPVVAPTDVRVSLLMPIHGHGGLGVPVARPTREASVWQVSQMTPSMSGSWQVRVDATIDGVTDHADIMIEVPEAAVPRRRPGAEGHG